MASCEECYCDLAERGFECRLCGGLYCPDHRHQGDHGCPERRVDAGTTYDVVDPASVEGWTHDWPADEPFEETLRPWTGSWVVVGGILLVGAAFAAVVGLGNPDDPAELDSLLWGAYLFAAAAVPTRAAIWWLEHARIETSVTDGGVEVTWRHRVPLRHANLEVPPGSIASATAWGSRAEMVADHPDVDGAPLWLTTRGEVGEWYSYRRGWDGDGGVRIDRRDGEFVWVASSRPEALAAAITAGIEGE